MTEIGVGYMRDKVETEEMIEALGTVDQDQVREQVQTRDRIRCFEFREYKHFVRRLPSDTSKQGGRTNPAHVQHG